MRDPRLAFRLAPLALLTAGLLVASCGTPRVATPPGSPQKGAVASAPSEPTPSDLRRARRAASRSARPPTPPPPKTTLALPGEEQRARAVRLVPVKCDDVAAEALEAHLREMRKAMRDSYLRWHAEQPECWERDREQEKWRKELEREGATGTVGYGSGMGVGHMWGSSVGAAFGAGGLGLSGAGEGGGGVARSSVAPSAKSFSRTNNQVASVDEADMVKTDGRYVYVASNGALHVALATDPKILSVTRLGAGTVRELFVEGDRAVVYRSGSGAQQERCTYGYDCAFAGDGSDTTVVVVDLADRRAPRVVRELRLSGSLLAARRIGNAIHTVVSDGDMGGPGYETWPDDLEMCGNPEAVVRRRLATLQQENERRMRAASARFPSFREKGVDTSMCSNLVRTPLRDGRAFTSVVSFDLTDDETAPTTATVQSRPGAIFASADALYVSVVHRRTEGRETEASDIHKFRIGERPGDTRYVASGSVPGHVLNQLAMDEWYGYLRVATTRGRVPDPNVSSSVSVLTEVDGRLVRVGAIDGIAKGEDIRAVRFDRERGYVVTFKKTDPLFVMDLHEPAKPRLTGELHIPGFSTYMHRIDDDHLLSIGFDAEDKGSFAYFDGVILQLFDVADATRPKLLHKEKIGTRGSSSQAATDHLAFTWFDAEGLLGVPMTICEGGGDGRNGDHLSFSGLLVYDVDAERGFTRLGGVDHGQPDEPGADPVSCGTWWSKARSAVKRSLFLDDLVYSVAPDRMKVQRTSALGKDVADLSLLP